VHEAEDVDVDRHPPDVDVRIEQPVTARSAGVEERHVDPTERVERTIGEPLHVVRVRDVGGNADHLGAVLQQLVDRSLQAVGAT